MATMEMDAESSALWHMLVNAGKATEEQLSEVYAEHERTGKSFATVLYNYGIVKEDELLALIARNLGTEVADLRAIIDMVRAAIDARVNAGIPGQAQVWFGLEAVYADRAIVERDIFAVTRMDIADGRCKHCQTRIAGVWG